MSSREQVSVDSWNNFFARTPLTLLEYQVQRTAEANRQAQEVARRTTTVAVSSGRSLEARISRPSSSLPSLASRVSFPQ
jgi:hypothetical protein